MAKLTGRTRDDRLDVAVEQYLVELTGSRHAIYRDKRDRFLQPVDSADTIAAIANGKYPQTYHVQLDTDGSALVVAVDPSRFTGRTRALALLLVLMSSCVAVGWSITHALF
jgi:hypothetical protein